MGSLKFWQWGFWSKESCDNARWFVAGLVVMALFWLHLEPRAGIAADAGQTPGVITAQSFRLVDDKGVVRGGLGFSTDDVPVLSLFDAQGREQLSLAANPDGPAIYLVGDDGNPMVSIYAKHDKSTSLIMRGQDPNAILILGTTTAPSIHLYHRDRSDNTPLISLVADKAHAAIRIEGPSGHGSMGMGAFKGEGSVLVMKNGLNKGWVGMRNGHQGAQIHATDGSKSGLFFAVPADKQPVLAVQRDGRQVWSATGARLDDSDAFGGAGIGGLDLSDIFK